MHMAFGENLRHINALLRLEKHLYCFIFTILLHSAHVTWYISHLYKWLLGIDTTSVWLSFACHLFLDDYLNQQNSEWHSTALVVGTSRLPALSEQCMHMFKYTNIFEWVRQSAI